MGKIARSPISVESYDMGHRVSAKGASEFIDLGVPESVQNPGRRESVRLDLVGLACEIATIASLVEERLGAKREPSNQELRRQCLAYRARALNLLAPKTNLAALPNAQLRETLKSFREDQTQLLQLATEAHVLLRR